MVVTGDPGSGKTAVLGLLAALTDPRRRPTVPRDGLPSRCHSREDAIDVAIYAGNLTTGQILAGWPRGRHRRHRPRPGGARAAAWPGCWRACAAATGHWSR